MSKEIEKEISDLRFANDILEDVTDVIIIRGTHKLKLHFGFNSRGSNNSNTSDAVLLKFDEFTKALSKQNDELIKDLEKKIIDFSIIVSQVNS